MAHISLNQYLQLVDEALQSGHGSTAADYLSCRHPHVASPRIQLERPDSAVQKVIDPPWDDVVSYHIKCIYSMNNHDFIEAYKHQFSLVQKILQTLKEENWALPIMYTCCLDLRILAGNADEQLTKKGKSKPGEMLERAADLIMGFFRVCASDNRSSQEDSKRWGMLYLVNQLFKIYFKINKLHLCKPLIRAIDSSNLKDMFKISQLVTYKYYVGQKAMFDSDFAHDLEHLKVCINHPIAERIPPMLQINFLHHQSSITFLCILSEEYLSFAFLRCHKKRVKNKRLILIYLIPVKMLLCAMFDGSSINRVDFCSQTIFIPGQYQGHMPSLKLLQKYDLMQFAEVSQAVVEGNLLRLNDALTANEAFFIKCGIYLILERLKIITYRNLFKKVHLLLKTFQIPVDAFLIALKFMRVEDIDRDEVLCILANLIYEGKIKGYISHQHQKLVVSKQNAFPALSSIS